MKWDGFLRKVGDLPIIHTEMLLAGVVNPNSIKVQISRWEKAGKIIQLKRGFYILSEEYRKIAVCSQYIASVLKTPSYISLEKALEYHNLIPEAVYSYTSVTTGRQGKYISKFGTFDYRHIKTSLFWGYHSIELNRQIAFIAEPEKALLDFFYLNKIQISSDYIDEMRLQSLDKIDIAKMLKYSERYQNKRVSDICKIAIQYIEKYKRTEKEL